MKIKVEFALEHGYATRFHEEYARPITVDQAREILKGLVEECLQELYPEEIPKSEFVLEPKDSEPKDSKVVKKRGRKKK